MKNCESGGRIAGGVEISAAFLSDSVRELVVTNALRHGWRAPDGIFSGASPQMQLPTRGPTEHAQKKSCLDGKSIGFEISISHANLQLSTMDIPTATQPTHKYCFLRYRFFDRSELSHISNVVMLPLSLQRLL